MAVPNPSTGFFSLPLELRQQIYAETLHCDGRNRSIAYFNPKTDPNHSLREADVRLASDLLNYEANTCEQLYFLVNTTRWTPPPPTFYKKLSLVAIDIEPFAPYWKREECLQAMSHNLQRFVAWFKAGGNKTKDLMIEFIEVEWDHGLDEYEQEDPCWTERGQGFGTILATRLAPGGVVTVIESLLAPLKSFPVVTEYVGIMRLEKVTDWCFLKKYGTVDYYESTYMEALFKTWENWLRPGAKGRGKTSWKQKFEEAKAERWRELGNCLHRKRQCYDCIDRGVDWDPEEVWDEERKTWVKGAAGENLGEDTEGERLGAGET